MLAHKSRSGTAALFLVLVAAFSVVSCRKEIEIDPKRYVAADALVYIDIPNVAAMLEAVSGNEKFKAAATSPPDLSPVNGVRAGISITGFETNEENEDTEQTSETPKAVLNLQPKFVAIIETNAWNFQALSFTEKYLGDFVNEAYGGEIVLDSSDQDGGRRFVWTSPDGRKAFAHVVDGTVLFGNDETALERSLGVGKGQFESIASNVQVSKMQSDVLASGYLSPDGLAQLSSIVGVSFAMNSSEEPEVQKAIATLLPQIMRNSIVDATWTAKRSSDGRIEDLYSLKVKEPLASDFENVKRPDVQKFDERVFNSISATALSVSRYDIADPQKTWQRIFTQLQNIGSPQLPILGVSSLLTENYGIDEPDIFLAAVESPIYTAAFDDTGDKVVLVTKVNDVAKAKTSLAKEFNFRAAGEKLGNEERWFTEDKELLAAFIGDMIVLGDADAALAVANNLANSGAATSSYVQMFAASKAPVVTASRNAVNVARIVESLAQPKAESIPVDIISHTETSFSKSGIERRTVSDFGLFGTFLQQLNRE